MISALLAIVIHKYLWRYFSVIYCAIVLVFWVHGNLLTYDLGKLDEHAIDRSLFRNCYIVEFAVWIGAMAIRFRCV